MSNENVLVIEDEEDILALVHYNLAREGYTVTPVTTGEEGLKAAARQRPDLILLDLMLPGMDGLEICRRLKKNPETASVPIIMVSARGEEADVVAGLELGAEDYVTKPFSNKVLLARIKTVLRRREREAQPPEDGEALTIGGISIHPGRNEVLVDGEPVDLTYTEFRVLHFLAGRPGWVFTRYQIVNAVRGDDYAVTDRAVDVQIVGLRKKLGRAGQCIETVRGVGYRFKDQG
ncbi:response regulator [Geoalkalibacter sp.]|uniref:response regulator n=1 Tax=Geoalkalibacter sp. TaxID=3041440 RepID=UPI00272EB825|nr:response regulator transcription factor [Geoalkalibacter sp.]